MIKKLTSLAMTTILMFSLGTYAHASSALNTETKNVGTKDYSDVRYTGTEFIAVGKGATISTLGQGTMWVSHNYEATGIDYMTGTSGGGLYVVSANKGRIQKGPAPNLLEQPRLIGTMAITIRDLVYSDGKWVAVGDLGMMAHSLDQGASWPRITNVVSDRLNSLAAQGHTWMAVGDNGATVKSSDGIMWMAMTKQYPTASFKKVSYVNGHWVAVGSVDGKGIIVSSTTTDQWETSYIDDKTTEFTSITSMGSQVAVAGNNGRILITSDPSKWEDTPSTAWTTSSSNLVGIAGTSGTWMAVSNTGQLVYSPSRNVNWEVQSELSSGGYTKLATGRNIFVAVGTSGQVSMIDPLAQTDPTNPSDGDNLSVLLPGLNKNRAGINIIVDKKATTADLHISGYDKAPLVW